MEIYLEFKKKLVENNDIFVKDIFLETIQIALNKIHIAFEKNLKTIQSLDYDQKLIFYINTAVTFGIYKSKVKQEYFDQIYINVEIKKNLIEIESIISTIDTINNKTIFYFDKEIIIIHFLYNSFYYLLKNIAIEFSIKDQGFKVFYENFLSTITKTKRRLKENIKPPRKKDDKIAYEFMKKLKENDDEFKKQVSTLNLPINNKSFEYKITKFFKHPHKICYTDLVYHIKKTNQDNLKQAFNEKEFYVALYDLLKAISYDKEHYNDDDEGLIYISYNSDVKEYKSKKARNWFS